MRSEWIVLTETKLKFSELNSFADDRKHNEIAWRRVTKIFGVLII